MENEEIKKGEKEMESEGHWLEVFSQGDVWELAIYEDGLHATFLSSDASDYPDAVDNGISSVKQRARQMGLKLIKWEDE